MINNSKIKSIQVCALSSLFLSSALIAEPNINDYQVERMTNARGQEITRVILKGSSFGRKTNPNPILWIFGHDVRENGQPAATSGIQTDTQVSRTGPNIWEHVDPNVTYDALSRHSSIAHSYFTHNDGTVRNPIAFGGSSPRYSEKIYFSARLKTAGDINSYQASAFSDISGKFKTGRSPYDEGEKISINGPEAPAVGKIIHVNKAKNIVTIATNQSRSDLDGAKIVGKLSNARLVLNTNLLYGSALPSKYYRMWPGDNQGLYFVLSTNRMIAGMRDNSGNYIAYPRDGKGSRDTGYGIPDISQSTTEWGLLETYINKASRYAYGYVDVNNQNRRYVKNIDQGEHKLTNASPTISQLGWDAAGGDAKETNVALNFGEIYFDNTPQRVMLSSSPTYSNSGSELELQYPVKWNDESIVFELHSRALNINNDLYVYVFDSDNKTNEDGFKICIPCKLNPPKRTEIEAE